MEYKDRAQLLSGGIGDSGGCWADLGSGEGAFTEILAERIGPTGEIFSIDLDPRGLNTQRKLFRERFPEMRVHFWEANFMDKLDLPPLDGILMANALHFVDEKENLMKQIFVYLKSGGRIILIEYNIDSGNAWVPHPISFNRWQSLAEGIGFTGTRLLAKVPSRYHREVYSALNIKP